MSSSVLKNNTFSSTELPTQKKAHQHQNPSPTFQRPFIPTSHFGTFTIIIMNTSTPAQNYALEPESLDRLQKYLGSFPSHEWLLCEIMLQNDRCAVVGCRNTFELPKRYPVIACSEGLKTINSPPEAQAAAASRAPSTTPNDSTKANPETLHPLYYVCMEHYRQISGASGFRNELSRSSAARLEFEKRGGEDWLERQKYVQNVEPPVLYQSLNEYVEPWETDRRVILRDHAHEHEWTFSVQECGFGGKDRLLRGKNVCFAVAQKKKGVPGDEEVRWVCLEREHIKAACEW